MNNPTNKLRYYQKPEKDLGLNLAVDLCVYGGNSGGIIAAITAKRNGLSVALLEPGCHLGGLTSGGLSYTDIGNKFAIGGNAREFFQRMGRYYDQDECWLQEPHRVDQTFREWLEEVGVECIFDSFLSSVEMDGKRIKRITTENGVSVSAKQFVDATYEGDLMAKAGVSYTVGREDNSTYGETVNGQQLMHKHQFDFDVDPYLVEGKIDSGLLPGIEDLPYEQGKGDSRVQAYNFRLCLTDDPARQIPFTEPEGYDRTQYELLARYCKAGHIPTLQKYDFCINGKYDMNNHGAVSTDFIGMNHAYPESDYATREKIFQEHVRWVKGLMWFRVSDPSIPDESRANFRRFGWSSEDFIETGGFSPAMYVREARRLVSDLVMNENHCVGREKVTDAVGLAAYTMDSHNCRRLVVEGKVRNEGDVQIKSGPPYPISYRSIIPKKGECENLCVPFCLSASHIAFGSIRMEPVFMILSQSSVEAAIIAMEKDISLQEVPYTDLRKRLLDAGQVIDPVPPVKNIQLGE